MNIATTLRRLSASMLAMLMLFGILLMPASASSTSSSTDLKLYKRHAEENDPFQAVNMFPGDSITKVYRLKVYYRDSITVHFRADVRSDEKYQKLAEVLMCRVEVDGKELYDGLMKNMPSSLDRKIKSPKTELKYTITAYLDTSVGNDYMNKELVADFRWWVEKQEQSNLTPPKTGDDFPLTTLVCVMVGSIALIVVLVVWKREKEKRDGEK